MARVEVQPGEALPAPDIIARLPSQAPPQTSNAQSGPGAADQITQQGSTLERSTRDGPLLPSTVIPDAGLPAQSPAAPGSSAPSRLEPVSTVPVEKSDTSRAPLGPTIASAGVQDFGRGSTLLPSRRGAADGHGTALPSIEGNAPENPAEVRRITRLRSQPRFVAAVGAGPAGDRLANRRWRLRYRRQPGGQAPANPVGDGRGSARRCENRRKRYPFRRGRRSVQARRTDQFTRRRSADCHPPRRRQRCVPRCRHGLGLSGRRRLARQRHACPWQLRSGRGPWAQRAAPRRVGIARR